MSASESKGDPPTSDVSEDKIPVNKSDITKPTEDAENTIKPLQLGVEFTKKDENDGNFVSIDSGTLEKGNIVDTNLKSFAEGDQIFDNIPTELSKTTHLEVPSASEAIIHVPGATLSGKNEDKTKKDGTTFEKDCVTPNPDINKTKKVTNPLADDNNPFGDLDKSFDDDLELRWEDDDKEDEYSTNLSDEALKLLDKELGIEDNMAKTETSTGIDDDIKQSVDINDMEEKAHKLGEDAKSDVVNFLTENSNTVVSGSEIDNNTATLPEIKQSTDEEKDISFDDNEKVESSRISESIKSDVNSETVNEEITISSSNTALDIKKDEIEHNNEQNQSKLITDEELISNSNNVKDVHDVSKLQKNEDTIEMDTDYPNIATISEITPNIEKMDIDLSENVSKTKVVDNPVEITNQSNNPNKQENQIKINTVKEIEAQDCTDIEMTETSNHSLSEIDSLKQIKESSCQTKSEGNLSVQEVPIIDKQGEVGTDENTETQATIPELNEIEVPDITKGMKTDLGLNKPDVMLEIPTQELIDIDDFDDSLETDKEIIDSELNNTSNEEKNTSTPKTKAKDKNVKLCTEQNKTTTQPESKESVKIDTDKEQSVIMDKFIPSDECVTESKSIVNYNEKTDKSSFKVSDDTPAVEKIVKIDDDSVIKESSSKTTHSNPPEEDFSKSKDGNMTTSTIVAADNTTSVIPISDPNNDCITEDQITQIHENMIEIDTSLTTENSSKAEEKNISEETQKLDQNMTSELISKPKNDNLIESEDKISKESSTNKIMTTEMPKNTEEPPKDNEKPSKLDETLATELISKKNENSTTKESSVKDSMIAELSEKEEPSLDDNNTAEYTKNKESPIDDNVTAEVSKESPIISMASIVEKDKKSPVDINTTVDNPTITETTSKPDDEGPEISDSLGLLAESSRVMEDDDQDEDDDSDDFDQDDESSNMQTAEHSEESNPPSDEAQPEDKDVATPDDIVVEGDTIYNEDTETGMEIVDDIVCEETDIVEKIGVSVDSDIKPVTLESEISEQKSQSNEEKDKESSDSKKDGSVLRELLTKDNQKDEIKKSPSKSTKLSISNANAANVMTYVDLEESSDDDIQEINKDKSEEIKVKSDDVTEENIIEDIKPKPTLKMTKLNTSEVTIKTGVSSKPPLIIPEITNVSEIDKSKDMIAVEKKNLLEEIYSLDSDSEDEDKQLKKTIENKFNPKCINAMCKSSSCDQHYVADSAAMRHYGVTKRRAICAPCLASVDIRNEALIKGIKDLTPLLDLNMEKPTNQLVEISDSESDDESDLLKECNEFIGQEGAKMLNEKLADLINDAWQKFNMDERLKDSENYINVELMRLEDEGTEIDKLLDECQSETDNIRNDLYQTFLRSTKELPSLTIHDTPVLNYVCLEKDDKHEHLEPSPHLRSTLEEPPAKRQNRGLTQTNTETPTTPEAAKQSEDDRDVSVVLLSAESAPEDLPPPGEVVRPPLRVGMPVHAMRNAFGSWLRGKILEIQPRAPGQQYTPCRVKFDHNMKNPCKVLPARCIAYQEPCAVRMTIGTRVLALFKDSNGKESFYSGVVAEIPNPVNSYRYLVFFDDGYAQYVKHKDTRLVCESKSTVWEEVHPFIRDFVKDYLMKYPERPMVRLHPGQRLNTEWNGKWWISKILKVDASLAHVHFEEDNRTEWIYRGSTRLAPLYWELQAAGRSRTRLPRSKAQFRTNMPYVEYMRSEEQSKQQQQLQQEEMIRRQRAVAKKSVSLPQPTPMVDKPDNVTSRVVYYTPKNAVKPYKMVPHNCGPQCRRTDVLSLKELRTYNPLAKPLLSGWERMQVRFKGSKHIMYRAPCGRRIRDMRELHRYLRAIHSDFPVDLFDFNVNTHCLAEFVLHKYNVMKKDLSHGKESVPVPCVNYYDDSLPEFCSYNTERTPTAGVPLNLDPDFLCGCDCEDDCEDKTKCACWKMTLEGARTIGLDSPNVGYVYRRLPEPLPSGIYECNSRCKCKSTCLNRVAQHPLQLKLQVFKTLKRGWGIRALNDVPKGSFLCVYAGNLLTDATANLDGLNEGDEYLAELDYIEVVEQMKEGFEEDIPDADKKLDKKESKQSSSDEDVTESEEDNRDSDKNDKEDDDFQPGYIGFGLTEFNKRLRKRGKKKHNEEQNSKENSVGKKSDDCITISDDEEVREPSRFTAQAGMGDKGFISKYRSVRSLFGKDEACYIMDAKVQGNIGRYLNHSCCPNVFVQNVFVDTHDPRFPWVAFFALSHIRAGTELTWNYNYDIGSVPGKILYCYCGAHNCRGRLL